MQQLFRLFGTWAEARRLRRITPDEARRRVEQGAAYLDDVDPGWHNRIDVHMLELSHPSSCVLGQLHGSFRRGLGRTSIIQLGSAPRGNHSPVDLGFQCVQDVPEAWATRDYLYLNAAWRAVIDKRRAESTTQQPSPVAPLVEVAPAWAAVEG